MRFFVSVLFSLGIACVAVPALAAGKDKPVEAAPVAVSKDDLHIAAVVGGDAVSSYDVDNRVRFIIATANFSHRPDVPERIRPQVIRSLIDERLQLQEAAKNDIKVTDDEIKQAIVDIEQQRGIEPGTADRILEENHIPKSTFTDQIRAQLAWKKLLLKKVKPRLKVSDQEMDIATRKLAMEDKEQPEEWQIAVIALPVDKAGREAEMHRLGDKLVGEIRGGASFEEVSRQFSSGAANAGGKVETFWVQPGQLDPAIVKGLTGAKVGAVTDPIRTQEGYTIVKVYDARSHTAEPEKDQEITLKEITLTLKPEASGKETDAMMQIADEVARHPGTCEEKGVANIKNPDDYAIEVNIYHKLLSELPAAVRSMAEGMKVGDISTPLAGDEGIKLFMLCGKKESEGKLVDRDRVYGMLMQQKMELEAQKYMRNLHRDVFIDIR